MQNLRKIIITTVVCITTIASYLTYKHQTLTPQEILIRENVQALTNNEAGSGEYDLMDSGLQCSVMINGVVMTGNAPHCVRGGSFACVSCVL